MFTIVDNYSVAIFTCIPQLVIFRFYNPISIDVNQTELAVFVCHHTISVMEQITNFIRSAFIRVIELEWYHEFIIRIDKSDLTIFHDSCETF